MKSLHFLSILAIVAGLLTAPAAAQIVKTFELPVTSPWFHTEIMVTVGETVTISASGSAYIGTINHTSLDYQSPAGSPGVTPQSVGSVSPYLVPGLPLWSLVGKIGTSGTPFEVGTKLKLTAATSGELYLSMNDNYFPDNSGTWKVTISLSSTSRMIAIASVAFSNGVGRDMQIDIRGTGFGSAPVSMPFSGTLWQLSFNDNTMHGNGTKTSFESGHVGDAVWLNYTWWSDDEIIINGFSGAYGYGNWYISPGDTITIRVSQVNSNDYSSEKATWRGSVPSLSLSQAGGKSTLQVLSPPIVSTAAAYQTLILSVTPGPKWPTRSTQPAYYNRAKSTYSNMISGNPVPVRKEPFTITIQVRNIGTSDLNYPSLAGTSLSEDALGQPCVFQSVLKSPDGEGIRAGATATLKYQVVVSWNTFKPPSNLLEPTSSERFSAQTGESILNAEDDFVRLFSSGSIPQVSGVLTVLNSLSAMTRLIGMKAAPVVTVSFHLESGDYAFDDPYSITKTVQVWWEPYKTDVLTAYLVDVFENIIPNHDAIPGLTDIINNLTASPGVAAILDHYSVTRNLLWYERALECTLPYNTSPTPPAYEKFLPSFQEKCPGSP